MARLYANENFPVRVVHALRALGHDVLTSRESGRANQKIPDLEVLRYSIDQKRALLTLNRLDFFRLHRTESGLHEGIVACTQDFESVSFAQRIHEALATSEPLAGKLVRVCAGTARLKLRLPLHTNHPMLLAFLDVGTVAL